MNGVHGSYTDHRDLFKAKLLYDEKYNYFFFAWTILAVGTM
jgi:hypothetical protein